MSQLVVSEVMPFGVRLVAKVAGEPRLVSMVEKHVLAQQSLAEKHVRTGGALPPKARVVVHQVLLDPHHPSFHHFQADGARGPALAVLWQLGCGGLHFAKHPVTLHFGFRVVHVDAAVSAPVTVNTIVRLKINHILLFTFLSVVADRVLFVLIWITLSRCSLCCAQLSKGPNMQMEHLPSWNGPSLAWCLFMKEAWLQPFPQAVQANSP